LSVYSTGSYPVKTSTDFNITAASKNTINITSGKVVRDGELQAAITAGSSIAIGGTSAGKTYSLVVVDSSNAFAVRTTTTDNLVPDLTPGDIPIAIVLFTDDSSTMEFQYFTNKKESHTLSVAYANSNVYTEILEMKGNAGNVELTGSALTDISSLDAAADRLLVRDATNNQLKLVAPNSVGSTYSDANAISAVEGEATLALTGDVSIAAGKDLTVDTDSLVVDSANDRVGIGIAAPQHRLDIVELTDQFPFRLRGNEGNIRINKYGHVQIQNENASDSSTIDNPIWQIGQRDSGQFDIAFGNISTQLVAASDAILSFSRAGNSATGNKQIGFFGATAVDRVNVGNISSAAVINPDVPNSPTAAEITSTQAAITALENKLDALIDALQLYGLIS